MAEQMVKAILNCQAITYNTVVPNCHTDPHLIAHLSSQQHRAKEAHRRVQPRCPADAQAAACREERDDLAAVAVRREDLELDEVVDEGDY